MLICIESFHQSALDSLLPLLKDTLRHWEKQIRFISFPSQGPFGHQIRVIESGRLVYHSIPDHLLRMVDRMDVFLNPSNGLESATHPPDLIILSESHLKEALSTQDEETQRWIIEINANIPSPKKLFWLVAKDETVSPISGFPPIELITFDCGNLEETAKHLADRIAIEVGHG